MTGGDPVNVTCRSGGCASATEEVVDTSSVGLRTSAIGEGATMVADAAGAWDTGLDAGADAPDTGRDPPKARLSLAPILFNVRSPTDQPPSSTFALVARSRFSFLNLLNASIRSSGVA